MSSTIPTGKTIGRIESRGFYYRVKITGKLDESGKVWFCDGTIGCIYFLNHNCGVTVVHHRILFLTFVQCDVFLIDEGKTRKVHVANIKDGPGQNI